MHSTIDPLAKALPAKSVASLADGQLRKLLTYLCESVGRVATHSELMSLLELGDPGGKKCLKMYICMARKYLRLKWKIKSIPEVGYVLLGPAMQYAVEARFEDVRLGRMAIGADRDVLYRQDDGVVLPATKTQVRILRSLAKKAMTREELAAEAGIGANGAYCCLSVHVASLRKFLSEHDPEVQIHTIRGFGYSLKSEA